jgi:hypothetical protein
MNKRKIGQDRGMTGTKETSGPALPIGDVHHGPPTRYCCIYNKVWWFLNVLPCDRGGRGMFTGSRIIVLKKRISYCLIYIIN